MELGHDYVFHNFVLQLRYWMDDVHVKNIRKNAKIAFNCFAD